VMFLIVLAGRPGDGRGVHGFLAWTDGPRGCCATRAADQSGRRVGHSTGDERSEGHRSAGCSCPHEATPLARGSCSSRCCRLRQSFRRVLDRVPEECGPSCCLGPAPPHEHSVLGSCGAWCYSLPVRIGDGFGCVPAVGGAESPAAARSAKDSATLSSGMPRATHVGPSCE